MNSDQKQWLTGLKACIPLGMPRSVEKQCQQTLSIPLGMQTNIKK